MNSLYPSLKDISERLSFLLKELKIFTNEYESLIIKEMEQGLNENGVKSLTSLKKDIESALSEINVLLCLNEYEKAHLN